MLTIELLKAKRNSKLSDQLNYVLIELRDNIEGVKVEDPANPIGNDLSELFDATASAPFGFKKVARCGITRLRFRTYTSRLV
ncbi:MAG TPA: hypothetical protein VFY40_06010 [Blastocatellia bacterium]|nr:hypothetical protein [Blastocatellia bacterium]